MLLSQIHWPIKKLITNPIFRGSVYCKEQTERLFSDTRVIKHKQTASVEKESTVCY